MTREEWAAKLNGREYREEMDDDEQNRAKKDDVLIVFGASDDLIEFRGIIYDEVGCIDGGEIAVDIEHSKAFRRDDHSCDCEFCGFKERAIRSTAIEAQWSEGGYSWLLKTRVPHSTFEIVEEGEKYCRGLVIDGSSL